MASVVVTTGLLDHLCSLSESTPAAVAESPDSHELSYRLSHSRTAPVAGFFGSTEKASGCRERRARQRISNLAHRGTGRE